MTPQELFEKVGRALVPGHAWQAGLAELMGVRPDSVRHFRSGRLDLRDDHFETLLAIIAERQAELTRVDQQLREWLADQPEDGAP